MTENIKPIFVISSKYFMASFNYKGEKGHSWAYCRPKRARQERCTWSRSFGRMIRLSFIFGLKFRFLPFGLNISSSKKA